MTESSASEGNARRPGGMGRVWVALLPLAWLWFILIDHLRIEWSLNPQYNYGWAVPFLCAFLLWRRVGDAERTSVGPQLASRLPPSAFRLLLLLLAFLYLPTRLVQEANPEWRLVSWAFALIVVGLTLLVLRWLQDFSLQHSGASLFRVPVSAFRFPLWFFLVAVPWPTVIEGPLIQRLARFNAAAAAEVLSVLGIPALRLGNVIEIGTGLVGVEDACSGIRSFQACLMIGLFLGAVYRLSRKRRAALVGCGFLLAIFFNLCRTVLLVVVASQKGIPAIAQWHDPAGIAILLACFLGVWGIAGRLARRAQSQETARKTDPSTLSHQPSTQSPGRPGYLPALALVAWIGVSEAGVEWWYSRHENGAAGHPAWTVQYPTNSLRYQEIPFDERIRRLLRFDEGRNASWLQPDGTRCQAIFLRWNPGRVAAHLARSHTPEVCLTASGRKLTGGPQPWAITVGDRRLSFDVYHDEREGLWVFYCLTEDGPASDTNATQELNYANRLRLVWAGRRNLGQRSLEVALWMNGGAAEAQAQAATLLQSIVRSPHTGSAPSEPASGLQ